MPFSQKSIDAVSVAALASDGAAGVGSTITFNVPRSNCSMQVNVVGTYSGIEVLLEVSIDGLNFVKVAQFDGMSGVTTAMTSNGQGFLAQSSFLAVRARVAGFAGSSDSTVTVYVSSAP